MVIPGKYCFPYRECLLRCIGLYNVQCTSLPACWGCTMHITQPIHSFPLSAVCTYSIFSWAKIVPKLPQHAMGEKIFLNLFQIWANFACCESPIKESSNHSNQPAIKVKENGTDFPSCSSTPLLHLARYVVALSIGHFAYKHQHGF